MISAKFSRDEKGFRALVSGHSGYCADGADIVCAAVSGLVYALVGYLANESGELRVNSLCSGRANIECGTDGEEAMKLCCIGLLQIALSYPGTLTVDGGAWGWSSLCPEARRV